MEINYIILKQGVDDNMTHKITIIGLGNYGLDDLPLGIYRFIQQQDCICTNVSTSCYRSIA